MFRIIFLLLLMAPNPAKPAGGYVGDQACSTCHAAMVDSFHATAHFLTSAEPTQQSILGSFSSQNILATSNPSLTFRMEAKDGGFYQIANTRAERFGLVVGSGEKGQTYLFWDDTQLFQLPVSYWRGLGWVMSPGYRDGIADFEREVIPRCLECHTTYFQATPPPVNSYSRTGARVGIQCEKCHGPGADHVRREMAKSGSAAASAGASTGSEEILNPAHFTRERQMDLCAWCHSGHGQPLLPSFTYQPGDELKKYIRFPAVDPSAPLDVHGNQVGMLQQSRCYAQSSMTCGTCHNVHTSQHDPVAFSERCLNCHKPQSAVFSRPDHPLVKNCIDCHMPRQETNLIVFQSSGKQLRPEIRSHWIKVYGR
jgi:hypothetical protein